MSRRRAAEKRVIAPDYKFNDVVVTKFINCIMLHGNKVGAEKIFYSAVEKLAKKSGESPIDAFHKALENVKPAVEVRSRRVGGATYQIPMEIRSSRKLALAIRWLISASQSRSSDRTMADKLASELFDAFNVKGGAVKRKDEVHRMAEANKAFAHYRW